MASDLLSIKPGQKCAHCSRCLDEMPYIIIFKDVGKDVICDICNRCEYMDDYKEDGIINSKLMLDAFMARFYFEEGDLNRLKVEIREYYMQNKTTLLSIANDVEEIHQLTDRFEHKHWLPYLKKYWNGTDKRGHIAESKNNTIMMWGCAGRVLITAKEKHSDITMIFADCEYTKEEERFLPGGRQRGGIQGINATKKAAVNIMNELINMEEIKFRPDDNVTMAGL